MQHDFVRMRWPFRGALWLGCLGKALVRFVQYVALVPCPSNLSLPVIGPVDVQQAARILFGSILPVIPDRDVVDLVDVWMRFREYFSRVHPGSRRTSDYPS